MINGSCCCGSIKFQLTSPPSMMGMCHCSPCRKVGASALAFVDKSSFNLLEGKEFIQGYVSADFGGNG
ncbi:GFA family protein [Undibacterium umbellatum]